MDSLKDLAAALNGHQITDDNGDVTGDDTSAEVATQTEQTPDTDTATPEKAETEAQPTSQSDEADDNQLAEDETGEKYIPKKRFDKVYGKYKATERELETLRQQLSKGDALLQEVSKPASTTQSSQPQAGPTKADVLELRMTLKQFDPQFDENGVPQNPDYSPELDQLGYQIWKANPTLSLIDAGKQAIKFAKSVAQKQVETTQAARKVKALQSDQGITSRVQNRAPQTPDFDKMSLKEKEQYLKDNKLW